MLGRESRGVGDEEEDQRGVHKIVCTEEGWGRTIDDMPDV